MNKQSAADRTLTMPGFDMRELRAEVEPSGPTVRRVALQVRAAGSVDGMHETHLAFSSGHVVCGAWGVIDEKEPLGEKTCQACRIIASQQRAVMR